MIVDVFMFDDEFDMLDCRLLELRDLVDRFIVIEGNTTFTGQPKPYHLSDRLHAYMGVPLTVVQADLTGPQPTEVPYRDWITPESAHAWVREGWQRNGARKVLNDLSPDTWVIYGDLDEIPRRTALLDVVGTYPPRPRALGMRLHVYSMSLVHPSEWCGSVVGQVRDLGTDVLGVRDVRLNFDRVRDAGWHLTWFGDAERRERKLLHISHQELVPRVGGIIGKELPNNRIHVDGQTPLERYEGQDYPRWVRFGYAPESWTWTY